MGGIERLKLDITTGILFGTEMEFNIERTIEYTNISVATKVSMKVLGYPHHRFAILVNYPVIVS